MVRLVLSAATLALLAGGTVRAADLGYTFKSVATLDSTIGGEPIQCDFEVASFNNSSDVAVCEKVTDSSAGPAGSGIFLWSKGKITTVARPGLKLTRGTLVDAWRPQISDSGIVTFEGKLDNDSDYGAYMAKDG